MDDALRKLWAHNIRKAREAAGLTQVGLAERCGVVQSSVARWESGRLSPTESNKIAVARVLKVPARDLFPLVSPDTVGG